MPDRLARSVRITRRDRRTVAAPDRGPQRVRAAGRPSRRGPSRRPTGPCGSHGTAGTIEPTRRRVLPAAGIAADRPAGPQTGRAATPSAGRRWRRREKVQRRHGRRATETDDADGGARAFTPLRGDSEQLKTDGARVDTGPEGSWDTTSAAFR